MNNLSNPVKAAIWMTGAMISFTIMAVGGRSLADDLDTFEIMMYRSLLGVVVVVAVANWAGTLGEINAGRLKLHITRNAFHFVGQNLWFYAVALIPLSQLFAFEFTTPLWVTIFAPFVLGEKWTTTRVTACLVGFAGILLISRPDIITVTPATAAAALCAIGFAGAVVCTKILARTESVTCILFWLVLIQLVFAVVFAGFDGQITMLTAQTFPWAMLVGACGLISHYCITNALKLAPATVVTPLEFLRLPLIAVVGFYLYDEPLLLSIFVGAGLILVANVLNVRAETKLAENA